ncbi:MAG: hypothetical protein MUF40_08125, partial [Gemmatimonadaceae bacterium]|nr:hypothetical protein [Gemmatimonadaceae bacterium]
RELAAAQAAQARAQAQEAATLAREAAQEARAAEQAAGVPAPGRTVVIGPDGVARELPSGPGGPPPGEALTIDTGPSPAAEIAREVKDGLGILAGACLGAMLIWLFFRTLQKWIEVRRTPASLPRESLERLARIENAIEAMAVEVERISEGQRFTTRLLSERAPTPVERG